MLLSQNNEVVVKYKIGSRTKETLNRIPLNLMSDSKEVKDLIPELHKFESYKVGDYANEDSIKRAISKLDQLIEKGLKQLGVDKVVTSIIER